MTVTSGLALVLAGAALSVALPGFGSARGTGMVGEAAAGVITEDGSKFGKVLIMQVLPGTQGLYGFLTAILLLSNAGVLGGGFNDNPISFEKGLSYFCACLPIVIVGYFSAIAQAKAAVGGVGIVAKNPDHSGKGIIFAAIVETYAVLALLISLLAIIQVSGIAL